MDDDSTISRKLDHVRIVLNENVAAKGIGTGFAAYRLPHEALPELDLGDVDLGTRLLGKSLRAPLLISSMTGGAHDVARINLALAEAAETLGIAMGVGSQRSALRDAALAHTYQVRQIAPHIPLLANLGAVQLNYGYGVDECRRAVEMIEADALILHLNALQEAVQPEGNTNFKGLLAKIEQVCARVGVPVIVKEVGNGIGASAARRLVEAGVWGIDVAGAGGTSWSEVERFRHTTDGGARVAGAFAGWGVPTTEAIRQVRAALPDVVLIGSGGIRSGVDVAKAIALGADFGATAKPALLAAVEERGAEAVVEGLRCYIDELRIAMFCAGCADLAALRRVGIERVNGVNLPHYEHAIVAPTKITDYLLSETHPSGKSKARFFRALGFNETNSYLLIDGILAITATEEVTETTVSIHGTKYVILGHLTTPIGRRVQIQTIWIIDAGHEQPRFVTAYPAYIRDI